MEGSLSGRRVKKSLESSQNQVFEGPDEDRRDTDRSIVARVRAVCLRILQERDDVRRGPVSRENTVVPAEIEDCSEHGVGVRTQKLKDYGWDSIRSGCFACALRFALVNDLGHGERPRVGRQRCLGMGTVLETGLFH